MVKVNGKYLNREQFKKWLVTMLEEAKIKREIEQMKKDSRF